MGDRKELDPDRLAQRRTFATEADLCRDLIAAATAQGWVAYPETAGWDLILVWPETGEQLGIEAKLRPSLKLAAQLSRHDLETCGPRFRAAAVGERSPDFEDVADALSLRVLYYPWPSLRREMEHQPAHPRRQLQLPSAPPRVEAGARSPRRADRWKAAGLRTLARLEVRGAITAEELGQIYGGNPPTCWFSQGWLVRVGLGRDGALYALQRGSGLEAPPLRWKADQPEAYAEALAIERRLAAEAAA